jgi:hypothetical protein
MAASKKTVAAAAAGGTGIAGFLIGKFSGKGSDVLLDKIITGGLALARQQGAYATFALIMVVGFGAVVVWAVNLLVTGKQSEIDRLVSERDRFQQLFIADWQSSKTVQADKGKKK